MGELRDSEVKVVVLYLTQWMLARNEVKGAIRTPTQAMSVPTAFRKGTICLPFVTELSRLGLNASPENNVRRDGWSAYRGLSRYSLTTV
jgi:hypothetical protein